MKEPNNNYVSIVSFVEYSQTRKVGKIEKNYSIHKSFNALTFMTFSKVKKMKAWRGVEYFTLTNFKVLQSTLQYPTVQCSVVAEDVLQSFYGTKE